MESLTKDQITHVLDAAFALLENKKTDELLQKLQKDVAATLTRLLFSDTSSPHGVSSNEKLIEKWNHLWDEWHEIVFEVGDEEGEYAYQEHHWEQPYFDGSALAADLDKIAEKMLPLLEKIYKLRVEDDKLFEQEMLDIEFHINAYPDWMGAEHGECYLDSTATRCVLRWEWLAADSAGTFVKRIVEIENGLSILELNDDTFNDFFKSLPEDAQKQIHEYITLNRNSPAWEERLKSSHSKWHNIYHAFAKSFNPETYLDNCRRMLHENWQYGLPLIKDLIEKKDYAGAEKVFTQSATSFLGQRGADKVWQPEESLLIAVLKYGYGSSQATMVKLLKDWIKITQKLSLAERTKALRLQLATYNKPYDWDAVANVFKEVNHPSFSSIAVKLIREWQKFILFVDLAESFLDDKEPDDCWIQWLIETGMDEAKDKKWFEKKVRDWLKSLCQNYSTQFQAQQKFISILTRDLADIYGLKKQYPNLYEVSKNAHRYKGSIASRQAWLGKMQGDQFIPLVIECWKRNVMKLIPDPSHAHKSLYDEHALWLAVARELNPATCQKVIAQWKVNHARRKNLWEAIRNRDVPV